MALTESATGLIISTDTGACLYKRSINMNPIDQNNLGILQAFLMTNIENSSMPISIKTENGYISHTIIEVDDSKLNISIFGNTSAESSEQCIDSVSQLLYILRNLIIIQIGAKAIEEGATGGIDGLKRKLRALNDIVDYVLSQPESPLILFNTINVTCHTNRLTNMHILQKFTENFQVEHSALWLEDKLYCCSSGWSEIHPVDQCLLFLYKKLRNKEQLYDFPIFLTHTSLVDEPENVGIDAYRCIIIHISPLFTLTCLSGPSVNSEELKESVLKACEEEAWMGLSKEGPSKSIQDCAVYYEVPEHILSWMWLDTSESIVRTFTRSELLLKSGHENPTPRVENRKSRYSRISQELTEGREIFGDRTSSLKESQKSSKKEDLKSLKRKKLQESEAMRDLIRLYLKLPIVEPVDEEQKEFESYTQESYIISEAYTLYVIKENSKQLVLLFDSSLEIDIISELSLEFNKYLKETLNKDYIFQ
ncbi:unnamed protein product [Moneuplotes crassus]|uniref:Uncharacterized protein n=1 Tax=Euplotes crassus TaxID=5936 RepID=A0AAD1UNL6_EUPCR|nr:unnamed protein product [Moneuplotes crassus]